MAQATMSPIHRAHSRRRPAGPTRLPHDRLRRSRRLRMAPDVGTEAPDFALKDQNNQLVTLSSFRGDRNVLVVFYPFAFSGICTGELGAVRDDLSSFQNADVQILALSVDHPFALKAWADAQGYEFPLLADF